MRLRIVVMIGLPGCGKSTYAAQRNLPVISSDAIRHQLADDASDQTIHARVFATVRYLLRQRLELGMPVTYIDATNLRRRDRRAYIRIGEMYDCDVEALFFDVPLEVCKARNRNRPRIVPEEAMDLLARRLKPPSLSEGFTRIYLATAGEPQPIATREPEPEIPSR
jgi:predicted kinase